ncbi:MAG: hypothetical protein R3A52_27750 [Polyangiales bacterium]
MRFSIDGLPDEAACYWLLLSGVAPVGLSCTQGHPLPSPSPFAP